MENTMKELHTSIKKKIISNKNLKKVAKLIVDQSTITLVGKKTRLNPKKKPHLIKIVYESIKSALMDKQYLITNNLSDYSELLRKIVEDLKKVLANYNYGYMRATMKHDKRYVKIANVSLIKDIATFNNLQSMVTRSINSFVNLEILNDRIEQRKSLHKDGCFQKKTNRAVIKTHKKKHDEYLSKETKQVNRPLNRSNKAFDEEKVINKIDYILQRMPGDGDCGYAAIGQTRENAARLLLQNQNQVKNILRGAVNDVLQAEEFEKYLLKHKIIDNALNRNNIDRLSLNDDIQKAYIRFVIRDKKYEHGWAHPLDLQALAHILNLKLYIWMHGLGKKIIPHNDKCYDYSKFLPPRACNRVDILYVDNSHYDRIYLVKNWDQYLNYPGEINPQKNAMKQTASADSSTVSYSEIGFSNSYFSTVDQSDILQEGNLVTADLESPMKQTKLM